MKITEIRVTPVNIRLDAPFYWSAGLYPGTSKVVVEVETDEGLTGLGEAPSTDCAELIRDDLQPRLTVGSIESGEAEVLELAYQDPSYRVGVVDDDNSFGS